MAANGESSKASNGQSTASNDDDTESFELPTIMEYESDSEDDIGDFFKPSDHLSCEEIQYRKENGIAPYDESYYAADTLKVLRLKLIRNEEDIEDDSVEFAPEMTYAVFDQTEIAVGYHGLKIVLYYCAGSLTTCLDISYQETSEEALLPFKRDDLVKMISEKLQKGFLQDINLFKDALRKEAQFRPYGSEINKFKCETEDSEHQVYRVYVADAKSCPEFKSYNERFQTFLLWYIEAANFIDITDEKWKFFVAYEEYENEGSICYAVAGYISVYEFFAYPNNIRPRVSQMLVLPPFQGQGIGAHLLNSVFRYYRELPNVTDISAESPSEDFQKIRDYVDCKAAAGLTSFTPTELKRGFSTEMAKEAKEKLKMSKKQALRVCNILRLRACKRKSSLEINSYIESLKQQVDKPHQEMLKRAKRKHLFESLSFKQVLDAMPSLNEEYRQGLLEKTTTQMMEHYTQVIERLNKD